MGRGEARGALKEKGVWGSQGRLPARTSSLMLHALASPRSGAEAGAGARGCVAETVLNMAAVP